MNDIDEKTYSSDLLSLAGKTSWTRREFVVSSLATGFALAVQPVCAQTVITTDARGLNAGEVKIPQVAGRRRLEAAAAVVQEARRCVE